MQVVLGYQSGNFFLIGFRNRLIVLLNWAWSYWTYQRHARIVLGSDAAAPKPSTD